VTKAVQVIIYESDTNKVEDLRKRLWKTGLEIQYVPIIGPKSNKPIEVQWEGGSANPKSVDDIINTISKIPPDKKDYGRIDDIYIEKENGQIKVDMYPHKFVQIVEEATPTKKNPEIKVDIAKFSRKVPETGETKQELNPARITYPKDYDLDKVIKSIPNLYKKKYRCPLCEERAREILSKVDKIVSSEMTADEQEKELDKIIDDMKKQNEEISQLKVDIQKATGMGQYPTHHPLGPKYDYLYERHDKMMERFSGAKQSLDELGQKAVETPIKILQTIFPPPDRLFKILEKPAIPQTYEASEMTGQQAIDNMPLGPPENEKEQKKQKNE